ncbi:MAG: hypothetical protein ACD_30C00003G0012 [uncultured bacterium]|uniref:Single-stranded-DNA-specific exonuclease RecJ n=3 Tax=Candidatus Daviesiibacteriota TaxID=1752718 RepID=A0A0G0F197_9BACT|nr:MAG: hypothetical protein ACD_30C00003G0012 [uncultured bacterium]KKQ07435.1 MAG: Exonuclease RecJ [Candidatus Daviesbacteria bacterium GW2011_GWB1_36_5]OGE16619.1 MAG: single-stranded-DNA-specific exonuclease RecJ [Candidatus Daviesbacteria bacterium RIFCSPHIGHO2_01_FULL_36_37]OGE33358.1 MAG: single-stranded-DNA-specific exonuclease RecJ [Candidatus Daviesbacteria bacterium RIFCSPHIGHO2_02_FULL_37_9]OGE34702.1 MAG: single-stranded-DNA-specific exonuclease RecJ [Candidatus Daviesbacteria bac
MPKIWKVFPKKSDDLKTQLLLNRGLKTPEDIEKFFNPKIENFQKEIEIPGIKKTWERIEKAIKNEELIVIFGDYDVDGISASAILYKALTSLKAKVLPYIPHREKEGYGLSKTGLDFARDSGASVVITVDNGIVAFEQALYAKQIGLDLIITDHHLPDKNLPEAYSLVHSVKMCGAGVAWCLIQDKVSKDLRNELLQFVVIATVCDLIPLKDLARAFLVEGLKVLNKTDNLGLKALFTEAGIENPITSYEVGHIIGPRINAIGRLEHAIEALRLLCTKDPHKAKKLAKLLSDTNLARQQLTMTAFEEAKLKVVKDSKIHILHSETWNQGIIGLIAGRISEQYYRPAIAISIGETISKGSARSIDGINIVEVIRTSCQDILIDIGGHSGAAGFSIQSDKIEEFKLRLEKSLESLPEVEKTLEIEAEVESKKLTKSLVKLLEEFAPFGFGNPQIIFATNNMKVSDIRSVGNGKHLKFKADGIDAIAFGLGDLEKVLTTNQLISLAYNLEINEFRGNQTLQLKVKDIHFNN